MQPFPVVEDSEEIVSACCGLSTENCVNGNDCFLIHFTFAKSALC